MEIVGKKIVKLQDATFKTHKNKNNERSIFIDQEIATNINLIDGKDASFIINEENLLRVLSFVSPINGIIPKEQFVSKVLFYLWTEIYKDEQGTSNTIFINSVDNKELTFGNFFESNGNIIEEVLIGFLNHILSKNTSNSDE